MSNIFIVGCGNMGSAFVKGFQKNLSGEHNLHIVDHKGTHFDALAKSDSGFVKTNFYHELREIDKAISADAIILCVKPQNAEETLKEYSKRISSNTLVISIMAGKKLAFFENQISQKTAIIRSMPTLGAGLGLSTTFYCENDAVTDQQSIFAEKLLKSIGIAHKVSEDLVEKSVAHFASGFGISALFEEMMVNIACQNGFTANHAMSAVSQNLKAISMLNDEGNPYQRIADMVTSKGGTTQAARDVMEQELLALVKTGMTAALERSKNLSKTR